MVILFSFHAMLKPKEILHMFPLKQSIISTYWPISSSLCKASTESRQQSKVTKNGPHLLFLGEASQELKQKSFDIYCERSCFRTKLLFGFHFERAWVVEANSEGSFPRALKSEQKRTVENILRETNRSLWSSLQPKAAKAAARNSEAKKTEQPFEAVRLDVNLQRIFHGETQHHCISV